MQKDNNQMKTKREGGESDVDVDVVYGRRRMPLCLPPQYKVV